MANVANMVPGLIIANFSLHIPLDDDVSVVEGLKRTMTIFDYSKLLAFGT